MPGTWVAAAELGEPVRCAARLSVDGVYRYELTRCWDLGAPALRWVMLNPSTAGAHVDDPTIRRCVGFARRWGYGGIVVHNIYALRATNPRQLQHHPDPVGPDNDHVLREGTAAQAGQIAICAWGALAAARSAAVTRLVLDAGARLACLGRTAGGAPRHPLYLRGDTQPQPFTPHPGEVRP